MASTIAAGTSAGTAIAISGDTSGSLQLQTNGTTTAVTISTAQVVTLAQPLPVASGGSGVTTSTGTGANVLGTSPTLTTPTFDSASLVTISGTAPLYMCRAWVNFNGTGTVAIRASGNVSSITDNGTGDYTVNFTTALVDANYNAVGMSRRSSGTDPNSGYAGIVSISASTAPTVSALRIWTTDVVGSGTASNIVAQADQSYINVAIFR